MYRLPSNPPFSARVTADVLFFPPVNFRDTSELTLPEEAEEVGLSLTDHSSQRAGHIGSTSLLCGHSWCKSMSDTRCSSGIYVYFKYAVILVYLGPQLWV